MLRVAIILLALLHSTPPALAQERQPVPPLATRVTDLTATLTTTERDGLETKLADFEHGKGAQIAVLMIPSVKPESIEEYAVRVMETWKLGRKDINDGVLLVVAKDDRKLRIEVGYGLEGALGDAVSKRIVSDVIAPRFKSGDFHAGIDAGVDAMVAIVSGEALPEPAGDDEDIRSMMLFVFAPMLLVLSFFAGRLLRAKYGRLSSAVLNAAGTASVSAIFFSAAGMAWAAVALGGLAFALTWPEFKRSRAASSWLPAGASAPDDDWSSRRSSSSGDSSDSSDSGFSGGGGRSGGGGASGDW